MIFALKFGLAAASAGLAWYAKTAVDDSSAQWEGRVLFCDYNVGNSKAIESVVTDENGQISELRVLYSDARGSCNISLPQVIQIDHITLVLRTTEREYWSIEKNNKVIEVQRSASKSDVIEKLHRQPRESSLTHCRIKESTYLNRWGIQEQDIHNISSKRISLNNVIQYIMKKEIYIPYSYIENCQLFQRRLLNVIYKEIPPTRVCNRSNTKITMKPSPKPSYISKINLLYTPDNLGHHFIGFILDTDDGGSWRFEQGCGEVSVERRFNNGDYNKGLQKKETSDIFSDIGEKKISVNAIMDLYRLGKSTDIKDAVRFMYYFPRASTTSLSFYNCDTQCNEEMLNKFLALNDSIYITEVTLLSRVAEEKPVSLDFCYVVVIRTSNMCWWTFERVKDSIQVQISQNKTLVKETINGTVRLRILEEIPLRGGPPQQIMNAYLRGLLEFVLTFVSKTDNISSNQFIKSTLDYLYGLH